MVSYQSCIIFLCWYHVYLIFHNRSFLILVSAHLSLESAHFGFLDLCAGNVFGQVGLAVSVSIWVSPLPKLFSQSQGRELLLAENNCIGLLALVSCLNKTGGCIL